MAGVATTQATGPAPAPRVSVAPPPPPKAQRTPADRVFKGLATAAGLSTLVLLGLIFVFLIREAWPALQEAGLKFFTTFEWNLDISPPSFGIGAVLFGTIVVSLIALVIAVPVSVGTALFINEYAPKRLDRLLTSLVDLLAAVPSIVYGLWGLYFLQPRLAGLSRWLTDHLGFIPLFHTSRPVFGFSLFVAGIVLAIMVLPIITSVSREVFQQTPRHTCEAALALGGTRWGMIRRVILPFGRSGVVGASMLGLGRAMGETIAAALILGFDYRISSEILSPGGGSVAGLIALKFPEAGEFERQGLAAAGLVLFAATLLVNMVARFVVGRAGTSRRLDS